MKGQTETSLAYKYFVAYRLYDGKRFNEVVIPYRPQISLRRKLRRALKLERNAMIILGLVCLLIAAISYPHPPLAFLLLVALSATFYCMPQWKFSTEPTHFGLSNKGLKLYWIRWFGDKDSPHISWSDIAFVRVRHTREWFILNEQWLDFIARDGNSSLFSIRLDGIVSGEQRKRLHTALQQFLPGERIEQQVHDYLNPLKIDNYTQLWLDVLSISQQRQRHNSLSQGMIIANGRYRIVGPIGCGGQGMAYHAGITDAFIGANQAPDVVLKEFVLPYHAGLSVSKKALERLMHEADLLSHLKHPLIVRLLDVFVEDQRAYLVLEHIPGQSLRQTVEEKGPLAEAQIYKLAAQMCDILDYLHEQNPPVIHRDFTPENLILSPDGALRLIDFNVAQQMKSDATRTVVGKHAYIPPEQFRGKATTQSDIYAMGASLYYLLTGSDPEPITAAYPGNVRENISSHLNELVAHCSEPEVESRFQCIADVRAALREAAGKIANT